MSHWDLFGDISDLDADTSPTLVPTDIPGLFLFKSVFSETELSELTATVEAFIRTATPSSAASSMDQMMRFGDLPWWTSGMADRIRERCLLPAAAFASAQPGQGAYLESLFARQPLFNQMILNVYSPGTGIKPHVDLLRFDDLIVSASFQSSCSMDFELCSEDEFLDLWRTYWAHRREEGLADDLDARRGLANDGDAVDERCVIPEPVRQSCGGALVWSSEASRWRIDAPTLTGSAERRRVFLPVGSVMILTGPARWLWKHSISFASEDSTDMGQVFSRQRRVSVTLRRLRDWWPDG